MTDLIGTCDCCGASDVPLTHFWRTAAQCETFACLNCQGRNEPEIELEAEALGAAYEAYWDAPGGTFKGIDAAIRTYMRVGNQSPQYMLEADRFERNEAKARGGVA